MIKLAFYSLFRRPLRQFLLFLLIALSAAVPVFLLQVTDGLYEGINHSVRPFPILVGAKGSSYQLVLNTVFLRDRPIGNIPYTEMDKLEDSGKVQAVYPLAFGDNYRGFRIVGTDEAIFSYKPDKTSAPWLSIAEGKGFGEEGAAVIGSETVRLAGLKIGDTFHSIHGLADKGKEHNHAFKVVGILAPCGGPYDTAIFVDIHEVWEEHGITTADKQEVTAILTVPKGYREAMQLLSAYQKNHDVQMVFPSQNVIQLYSMNRTDAPLLDRSRCIPDRHLPHDHAPRHVLERTWQNARARPLAGTGRRKTADHHHASGRRRHAAPLRDSLRLAPRLRGLPPDRFGDPEKCGHRP